jgi:hypothetical protein
MTNPCLAFFGVLFLFLFSLSLNLLYVSRINLKISAEKLISTSCGCDVLRALAEAGRRRGIYWSLFILSGDI